MITLADRIHCTACGACEYSCPKQAIRLVKDDSEDLYPFIDDKLCVSCHICERNCPALKGVGFNSPLKAYAAWNSNSEEMRDCASGGIATAAYHFSIKEGYIVAGAVQNKDMSVTIQVGNNSSIVQSFKNSKYVFSSLTEVYSQIKKNLDEKKKVIVIALPCQIAALRRVFKDNKNLILGDVVCHGVISIGILQQYLHSLERQFGKKISRMYFRDPNKGTQTFTFSLYDEQGNCIYAKKTREGELYNYAYHGQIAYRENCYHCNYARNSRVSDFTLSDYKGLGKLAPWNGPRKKISSILINTEVGDRFINQLVLSGQIYAYERPVNEPIQGDPQLNHPSRKTAARKKYEKLFIKEHGDFVKVIKHVRKYDLLRQKYILLFTLPIRAIRKIKKFL